MFSGTVKLGDLDDYISPAQDCVLMANAKKREEAEIKEPQEASKDENKEEKVLEAEKKKESTKLKLEIESDARVVTIKKPSLIKLKKGTDKAVVNLYDCLACSGCVTSSEVVLMKVRHL